MCRRRSVGTDKRSKGTRTFIPLDQIATLYGKERGKNGRGQGNKRWLEQVQYVSRHGGWGRREMCVNFKLFLTGNASIWYDQLTRSTVRSWKELKAAFQKEFCTYFTDPHDAYYHARQKPNEMARHYFWRITALGKKARRPLDTVEGAQDHFNRFVMTLQEERLRASLRTLRIGAVKDVENHLIQ